MPAANFTPDDQLELLFSPKLIPAEVQAQLGHELHMRPLSKTDLHRSHLSVLSVLTSAPEPSEAQYIQAFNTLLSCRNTYFTLVIISRQTDQVVGVGTVFLEQKFTRNLGRVGHIEDIAVDKRVQGHKLGLRIIQALTGISEKAGCYKTILDCSDANIPFYEKCGFEKKENEMVRYNNVVLDATPTTSSVVGQPKLHTPRL